MTNSPGIFKVLALAMVVALCTGCSIPFIGSKNNAEGNKPNAAAVSISTQENSAIRKAITDYYKKLYSGTIEGYSANSASGSIPAGIKEFIAKRTLDEGDNNPEVGIHLPRYVEINGLTAIALELASGSEEKDGADIDAAYLGNKNGAYMYYVKVDLKAKCLPSSIFDAGYKQNAATHVHEKSGTVDGSQTDYIKVQARYDVEVLKEENSYKILTAREASIKPGYQNRLFTLNNEFLLRLPYLNIEKSTDGKTYLNKADGEVYDREKAIIEAFFNNLLTLDSERMNLLYTKWNKGAADFKALVDKIGLSKSKDSKELVYIGGDYRTRFDFASFPLQINMEKVKKYNNFKVVLHPGYSDKQKRYIVTFQASVEKINGIMGNETLYSYDYFVTLSGKDDSLRINGIRLNEYYTVDSGGSGSKK